MTIWNMLAGLALVALGALFEWAIWDQLRPFERAAAVFGLSVIGALLVGAVVAALFTVAPRDDTTDPPEDV